MAPLGPRPDWLLDPTPYKAGLHQGGQPHELVLGNGLLSRTFRLHPNAATVAFDNLMTGASLLRGVKPEARVELDGVAFAIGGLLGQEEYAYLRREWLDQLTADPAAFQYIRFEIGPTRPPFAWRRRRSCAPAAWPPPGIALDLHFAAPPACAGVEAVLHYELYDGLPLLGKWLSLRNGSGRCLRLDTFVSELLAVVEGEVSVDGVERWETPDIHVESDYAFHDMTPKGSRRTVYWVPDPQYTTQVNYERQTPCLLECRPPLGPGLRLEPGQTFTSFRTFELVHDSTERERRGLAQRRLYRTLAPWTQENPILMHVRQADPESVQRAVDQCAEVGFEMVIMTFGSGFDAESEDPAYLAQLRQLAEYAHQRGVELGGYSLLASRRIGEDQDVINPETGATGGAIFGHSPCLGSAWGREYFRKLEHLYAVTGLDVLEHDGSYPGDPCASQAHPGHEGLADSQWRQWERIRDFYHHCRAQGIYLNVPDWYFLSGANKTGMGYRETNWSLPRDRQLLLARQNLYDGTWQKTPSMGWMFVPLVEYHGGGEAATLEPLGEHLDAYEAHLAQNLGWGVQACYRGPRLYDSEQTRAVVARWVAFYKEHRAILESDIIHLRRADGHDLDGILHVNPALPTRGLAMIFNPLDHELERTWKLPLYYTGLTTEVLVREEGGPAQTYPLDRECQLELTLKVPARGRRWYTLEAGA
ncbi:MAG: alpha-galactosidase [Candidatus Latescibacteria bacterium]|nr:alpha-galactosidase [Candidatus Latescibacterota bacterium]